MRPPGRPGDTLTRSQHEQLKTYLRFHGWQVPVEERWYWLVVCDPGLSEARRTVAAFRRRRTPAPLPTGTDALDPRGSTRRSGEQRAV